MTIMHPTFFVTKREDLGKWHQRYIEMAEMAARWSKDPSKQVGAAIVSADGRAVTVGYNGPPPGVSDEKILSREDKNRFILHAERNALDNAWFSTEGATLYATRPLCCQCAASVVSKGILRVVCPEIEAGSSWYEEHSLAFDQLLWGHVEVVFWQ